MARIIGKERVFDTEEAAKACEMTKKERVFVVELGDAKKFVVERNHIFAAAKGARALGVTCGVLGSIRKEVNIQESVLAMPEDERQKLRELLDQMDSGTGKKRGRKSE